MYDDKYGIITYCDVSCCSSILATVTFDEFWWCILIMIWKVYIFINALKTLTKQQQFAPHRRKANLMLNVFYGVIILIWSAMYRFLESIYWHHNYFMKLLNNQNHSKRNVYQHVVKKQGLIVSSMNVSTISWLSYYLFRIEFIFFLSLIQHQRFFHLWIIVGVISFFYFDFL